MDLTINTWWIYQSGGIPRTFSQGSPWIGCIPDEQHRTDPNRSVSVQICKVEDVFSHFPPKNRTISYHQVFPKKNIEKYHQLISFRSGNHSHWPQKGCISVTGITFQGAHGPSHCSTGHRYEKNTWNVIFTYVLPSWSSQKNTSPLWRQQKKVLIFPGFSMEYFSISLHFTASIDATSYHHPRSSRFYTNFFWN